jgi:hypothetical protein
MPKDTEQDVVLAPADYWEHVLQPKLESFLRKKNSALQSENTTVAVSVTARSIPLLTKLFDDTAIDWPVIEKQLVAWGELFRVGKKLRLNLSFNYVDSALSSTTSSRRIDKRGSSSTTRQMLTERAAQLDAEQESTGQPSIWRKVYDLMRCPGRPTCGLEPHCWCDPVGKKHYKLSTHHMRSLITYVQQGNTLQTHDDVPEDFREQLYAEEQQSLERHRKATSASTAVLPPNITNVLPGSYQAPPHSVSSPAGTPTPDMPSNSAPINCLHIPGPRDEAVEDYCAWQQSQVKSPG